MFIREPEEKEDWEIGLDDDEDEDFIDFLDNEDDFGDELKDYDFGDNDDEEDDW